MTDERTNKKSTSEEIHRRFLLVIEKTIPKKEKKHGTFLRGREERERRKSAKAKGKDS